MRGEAAFPPEPVLNLLDEIPEVQAAAPAIEGFVMMIHRGQAITAVMRGIDPEREKRIADIESFLIDGSLPLEDETVVLGRRLAMTLGARVGDRLTVYSPQCFVSEDELRLPAELTVSGIFSVGMYDVDSQFMIASLSTARDVFVIDSGVQSLRIITDDPYRADAASDKILAELRAAAGSREGMSWLQLLYTRTWMEIHRSLLSTLKVEKDMMFILFCFIFVVAAFSITNSLITLCVQKTHEIGLLKSLGFSAGKIVGVFFLLGFVQGVFGCIFGILLGWIISSNLDPILAFARKFNSGLMPVQFYQFPEMPSRMTLEDVVAVCIVVLVFSTLAGVLPAVRAARMEPVDALRYE
jgi:lipoprotein-releasing system permease protein